MKRIFLILAFVTSALTSWAHDFAVDGIYYNITSSADLTVSVTYRGSYSSSYSNEYSGVVVIPDSVTYKGKTYSVTSIRDEAFYGCSGLTSITIPKSVTSIGNYAFEYCNFLREVVLEDGGYTLSLGHNCYSSSKGEGLFYDCPLESVYLGRNLTYDTSPNCGYSPFYSTKTLTSVIIGDSVTSIGNYAFNGCSGLTSITIPESVTSIGSSAFYGCSGLTSIAIPKGVTSIGSYAFYDCSGLTTITIPESVTSIGSSAFYGCSSLFKVLNCSKLPLSKGSSNYGYVAYYAKVVLNCDDWNSIGDYQFCTSDSTHFLVNYVGDSCELILPDSYNGENYRISDCAFYGCGSLTSITIPKSVTSIGNCAFEYCNFLREVVLEDGGYTLSLGHNYYSSSKGEGLFYDCPLESVYLGRNLTYEASSSYGYSPFYNTKTLTSVIIGDSVTSIRNYAFYGCSGLNSITIPKGITSIGSYAFYGCSGLASITIPEGVTSIGNYAFVNCSSLTSITIPESVASIGSGAFSGCSSLTSITLPESVTSISNYAFDNCSSLKEVIFEDGSEMLILGYNYYSSSSTGKGLFYDCPLESVYLGRNLTYDTSSSYGYSPFYNTKTLTSVIIGDSVTSIGDYAFLNCSSLTSIFISEGVTSIGRYAFSGCSGLTSITIPESITSISSYAFRECKGLHLVIISSPLASIGSQAFSGCSPEKVIWLCNTPPQGHSSLNGMVNYVPNEQYKGKDNVVVYPYLSSFFKVDGMMFVPVSPSERTCDLITCSYDSITTNRLAIPEKVQFKGIDMNVKSVGPYAFCSTNISELDIEKGISAISSTAFLNCSRLAKITISDENATFDSRNDCNAIIEKENGKLVQGCMNTVIPQDVKTIGDYAFYECSGLTSITIPKSVTSIGSSAFYGCSGLESAVISMNFSSDNDKPLILEDWTSTNKTSSSTSQNTYTFTAKKETTLSFDWMVSSEAKYDKLIVTLDGTNILEKSGNLSGTYTNTISPGEHTLVVKYTKDSSGSSGSDQASVSNIVVENASTVGRIGNEAFSGCSSLKSVTLGDSIRALGNKAFYQCTSLQEIVIPDAVFVVGESCFSGCAVLTNVEMGNGITSIGDYAFKDCSSLLSISIPRATANIGNYVFSGCTQLADIIIEDRTTVLSLGSNGSSSLFANCPLDSVYIGGAISYNTSSSNGYSPFYRNTSLRTVVITNREEQIYDYEFYGCTNLKNVTIGNGVKSIGKYAFSGCSSLTGFSFGSNMETIDTEAFSDCTKLTSITSYASVPPTCGTQALDDVNKWECVLRVPIGYTAAYQAADQWKDFFFVEDVVELERYVLTYMVDGEVYYTDTLVHKETVTHPEMPVKEGYTFSGWDKTLTAMPAEDATINGAFIINKYLVTFKIGDEVIAADSLEYGAAIVAPEAPEKEGHTFDGWGDVAETVPAGDVTYEGTYTVNVYNVYYYVGEELVHTAEVAYGEAIPEYVYEPTEEGHTFMGWIGDTYETMPAHDVTYMANIDDAIEELTIDNSQLTIYDLTGRKLDIDDIKDLSKGIYIINGKQVLVK